MAQFDREYGVAATITIPLFKAGTTDYAVTGDWTPAAGDVKISKDAGNVANIATLPVAVGGAGSVLWKFVLSATEGQAKNITIQIVDAALEDDSISITTYGNASAQHAFNRNAAINVASGIVESNVKQLNSVSDSAVALETFLDTDQSGILAVNEDNQKIPTFLIDTTIATLTSQTSFTLSTGSTDDDAYNGGLIVVTDVSTAVQKAVGIVKDYVGSTKTVTLLEDPAIFTMAVGDIIEIIPDRSSLLVDEIKKQTWDRVHFDSGGTSGTAFPAGTPRNPADSLSNAILIANTNNLKTILINNGTTMPAADLKKFVAAAGQIGLNLGGALIDNCHFHNFLIAGSTAGSKNFFWECQIEDSNTNLGVQANVKRCTFIIRNDLKAVQKYYDCQLLSELNASGLATSSCDIVGCKGNPTVKSLTTAGTINFYGFKGDLTLDSTCTAGTIKIRGLKGKFTDNSAGTTVDIVRDDNSDAILVDTADMQPKLGTPAADISADIAAVKVDTAATLVDTADIQSKIGTPAADVSADIAAVKVNTAATLVDTTEIGAAGAGLTDLGGMSTVMKGQINTEVDGALNTVIPGVPTAGSINDVVKDVDAKLPTNNFMGSAVKTDKDDEIDAIKAKTDNLPADPASETNVNANETKIDAVKVDTAAILVDTGEIGTAGAGLTDLGGMSAAMKAEINTEVDGALDTAIPELAQAAPSATPSVRTSLALLNHIARDKTTTTATEFSIFNDADSKIIKQTIDDTAGKFTRSEAVSGA